MAPVVIPGVDVPLLTGPLVLGYMFSYGLYGALIVQVYVYSEAFPKDRAGIKAVVWTIFLLETIFTVFMTIASWNQYGPGWGDPDSLIIIDWSWEPLPALNGVLAGIAQSFYIWRIWGLTRRLWLVILIGSIMITQVTVAFYYGIVVSIEGRGVDKLFALSPEITLWLTSSAACDLGVTISLVHTFSRQKQRSGFNRTQGILNKLIRFSVETGAITSFGAIIEVILWLASGHKWNIHFIFFLVIGKLYSNMLMATLNARAPLFRGDAFTSTAPQTLSTFWADAPSKNARAQASGLNLHAHPPGVVHISQSTSVARDDNTIAMDDFNPMSSTAAGRDTPDKAHSIGGE